MNACVSKFFLKVKPLLVDEAFPSFPVTDSLQMQSFFLKFKFQLNGWEKQKFDYVKPEKHLEMFTFESFEYSYSKHVFSKETKSDNAFKLL